jgi:hypothetical protein
MFKSLNLYHSKKGLKEMLQRKTEDKFWKQNPSVTGLTVLEIMKQKHANMPEFLSNVRIS